MNLREKKKKTATHERDISKRGGSRRISVEHAKNQEKIEGWGPERPNLLTFSFLVFIFCFLMTRPFCISDVGFMPRGSKLLEVHVSISCCWGTAKQPSKLQNVSTNEGEFGDKL